MSNPQHDPDQVQPHAANRASPGEIDINSLLLIVVGSHLHAELHDRPMAYRLREGILRVQDRCEAAGELDVRLVPLVCTDVWYLNSADLQARPAIAIGDPGVNAASAYLSTRLPTAFVIEKTLRVHADTETIDLRACLWGVTPAATASAVDLFVERYLNEFIRAAQG
jgi:hypothetical protein